MKAVLRALLIIVVLGVLTGAIAGYSIVRRGLSTRTEPSAVEQVIAMGMRRLATPATVRDQVNPVRFTEAVANEALEHFADHCAVCHANNGSGDTPIGLSLYPRAPDMRGAHTQQLTDGELFSIIEQGVRLTGMPAWSTGTPEGAQASWALVHFIRRLASLTPEDIARMEDFNPRSTRQLREEEEVRRFLAGEEPTDSPTSDRDHARRD